MPNFASLELLIKTGRLSDAKVLVRELSKKKPRRSDALAIANFSRRAGLPGIGLRLLNKFIRKDKDASELEKSEYAILLINAGYYTEGIELLESIKSRKNSETFLYLAFAKIYQWDYQAAQPYLESYLRLNLNPYQRLVGQVNLAAGMIMNRDPKIQTLDLLNSTIESARAVSAVRLQANALELKAQIQIDSDEFSKADACLTEAEKLIELNVGYDGLFIKKWRALLDLKKTPKSARAREKVLDLRRSATLLKHWETIRDCDFYLGLWHRNRSALPHVYFGTPFQAYKKRVIDESRGQFSPPHEYLWRLNSTEMPKKYLDLRSGQDDLGRRLFDVRRQSMLLLFALSSDFYRPLRLSDLATKLFPNEYYDPNSTPDRVHQALKRLRLDLEDSDIPIDIQGQLGFRLRARSSYGLLIPAKNLSLDFYSQIKSELGNKAFKLTEAQRLTGIPRRTLQSWVTKQINEGLIAKIGSGPSTQYILKK